MLARLRTARHIEKREEAKEEDMVLRVAMFNENLLVCYCCKKGCFTTMRRA